MLSFARFFVWVDFCFKGYSFIFNFEIYTRSFFRLHVPFLLDWIGLSVVFLVNLICACVFGFSLCYLGGEDKKLLLLISSFVFGM